MGILHQICSAHNCSTWWQYRAVLSKQVLYSYSEISMTHHPYVHPSIYLNDSLCSFQCVFVVVYKHVILSVVVVAVYNLSVFVVVVYKHVIHVRHGS